MLLYLFQIFFSSPILHHCVDLGLLLIKLIMLAIARIKSAFDYNAQLLNLYELRTMRQREMLGELL